MVYISLGRIFLALLAIHCCADSVFAMTKSSENPRPTYITADEITIEQTLDKATAQGHVIVRRDGSTLTANRVEVYFSKTAKNHSIALIKAFEAVRIENPENVAQGDFGTYDCEKDEIVLEGNVCVTDHKNQIKGSYGVMNRKTGITKVLNHKPGLVNKSPNARVSAMISSNE